MIALPPKHTKGVVKREYNALAHLSTTYDYLFSCLDEGLTLSKEENRLLMTLGAYLNDFDA